ncbi:subunit of the Arp2/3 complex [Entophlyctis luteolus]|nr:subunit of the Arp2/3 complex [Entophlyctis luteolus]
MPVECRTFSSSARPAPPHHLTCVIPAVRVQAFHSAFDPAQLGTRSIGKMALLPVKSKNRGPVAPPIDPNADDIVDEAIYVFRPNCFFRNFQPLPGGADHVLIYLQLFIQECLQKLAAKNPNLVEGQRLLQTHAMQNFSLPGDSNFPLNPFFEKPATKQDAGRVYLQSLEPDGESFIAGRPFRAVYASTATSVVWTAATSNCAIAASTSASTLVTCSQRGVEGLTVYRNGDTSTLDTLYVTLASPSGCFQWYMYAGWRNIVTAGTNASGYLWIVDPTFLAAEEAAGSASAPTVASKSLSASFASIGEYPRVLAPAVAGGRPVADMVTVGDFDASNGVWPIYFDSSATATARPVPVVIAGHFISIVGCMVENRKQLAFVQPASAPLWTSNPVGASPASSSTTTTTFATFKSACEPNFMLATSSLYGAAVAAVSNAAFQVSGESLLTSILNVDGTRIASVAMTPAGVAVLTGNSLVYFVNATTGAATLAQGIAIAGNNALTNLRAVETCAGNVTSTVNGISSVVVAWTQNVVGAVRIFVSSDGGRTFGAIDLARSLFNGGAAYVRDVAVSRLAQGCVALVRDGNTGDRVLVIRDLSVAFAGFAFSQATMVLDSGIGAAPFVREGLGALIFAGDAVYLSPNLGISMFKVTLTSRNPSKPATGLDTSEYITQAAVSPNGAYLAALTSTNRSSRPKGDFGASVFSISSVKDINFCFMIKFSFTNYSLVTAVTTITAVSALDPFEPVTDYKTLSTTLTLSARSVNFSGVTAINLQPRAANLACLDSSHRSAIITVGCPPTRRIVLKTNSGASGSSANNDSGTTGTEVSSAGCDGAPASFVLPAGTWVSDWTTQTRPPYDLTVAYDCAAWGGAPLDAYYGVPFVPAFYVVDNDAVVKPVDADFGLWELHGRQVAYTLTASDAGCISAPQSWWGMMVASHNSNPLDAWGRWNYSPCYNSSGAPVDGGTPYTVFNSTNGQGVVWIGGYNGIYVFTARVLDPNFSYCNLSVTFAVNVYGAPLSPGIQAGIMLGFLVVLGGLLAGSYLWFLHDRRREVRNREMEVEKLKEGQNAGDTSSATLSGLLWKEKTD